MTSPTAAPPVRFCPFCKQADDHPRHDRGVGDPLVQPHMDCCAASGCPDGSCPILIEGKNATGDAWRETLMSEKFAKKVRPALDARDEATRTYTIADVDPSAAPITLSGANQ